MSGLTSRQEQGWESDDRQSHRHLQSMNNVSEATANQQLSKSFQEWQNEWESFKKELTRVESGRRWLDPARVRSWFQSIVKKAGISISGDTDFECEELKKAQIIEVKPSCGMILSWFT